MKTKNYSRVLSVLLALCMLLALLPTLTFSVAAATEVTLTPSTSGNVIQSDRYLFTLDGLTDSSDRYWNNNTVYINGKAATEEVHYVPTTVGSSTTVYLLVYPQAFGVETMAETPSEFILQIKAGTSLSNGAFTIAKDVVWKISNGSIVNYTPTTLITHDILLQDGNERLYIRFKDKYGLAYDTADIYWNNNTVLVDGNPVSENINWWHGHCAETPSKLTMFPQYSSIQAGATTASALGVHTLTIPYGTILGGKYMVVNEVTYSINGSTIVPVLPQTNVTLSNDETRNASSGANGFYFYVDPADPLAYDATNWSYRYPIKSGSITLNDTTLTNAGTIVKRTSNLYYVALIDNGLSAVAGDVVTVDCSINDGENQVNFQKQQFVYNGTSWELYVPSVPKITGVAAYGYNGNYLVALAGTERYTGGDVNGITAIVNGETKTDLYAINHDLGAGNCVTLVLPGYAASEYYEVVLPAGNLGNSDYVIEEDLTLYAYNYDVSTVCPVVKTGISNVRAVKQEDRYYIEVNLDSTFADTFWEGLTVYVDGVATNTGINFGAAGEQPYFLVYPAVFGVTSMSEIGGGHTVEIREKSIAVSSNRNAQANMMFTNSLTYYTYADGSMETDPPAETETVQIAGATIKTETDVSKQGMRYEVTVDAVQAADAQEFGVLLLPETMLGTAELSLDVASVLRIRTVNGDEYWDDVLAAGGFQAVLTNGTINGRQNLKIVSRSYIIGADGTVTYGEVSSRSITSVAQAIAQSAIDGGATATDAVTALLSQNKLSDSEIATVIAFCRDNIAYL